MKLSPIAATATVVLAAAAPALAAPAIDSGTYKGNLKGGGSVQFKVTGDKQLTRFQFKGFKVKCSDGDRFRLPKLRTGGDRLYVTDAGRFEFTASYAGGVKWKAGGTIAGNRAKGKIRTTLRFNRRGQVRRNGAILCESTRRFSVRHG